MFADTGHYIPRGFSQRFAEAKRSDLPRVPSVTVIWRPDRAVHLIAGLAGAVAFPFFVLASVSSGLPFGIAAAFAIAHLAATAPSVGPADRRRLNAVLSILAALWAGICVLMVSAGFSPVSFLAEALVSVLVAAVPLIAQGLLRRSDDRSLTERELSCLDAYSISNAVIVTDRTGTILGSTLAAQGRISGLSGGAGADILEFIADGDRAGFAGALADVCDDHAAQECCVRVTGERMNGRLDVRMTAIAGDRIAVSFSPAHGAVDRPRPADPAEQAGGGELRPAAPAVAALQRETAGHGPTGVGDVIDFAMRLMRQEADYAGLCVELKETDPDLQVACGRRTLIQIVVNVLGNAIKFSNFAGLVTVAYANVDGAAVIRITDEGIGIAQGDGERIFKAFGRAGDKTRDGHGLGLAVVDELITENCGSLRLTSRAGLGTTVEISLPLAAPAARGTGAGEHGRAALAAAE